MHRGNNSGGHSRLGSLAMAKPSGPATALLIEAPLASHVDCIHRAPVAQLDRAVASGATGREFESLRAHHSSLSNVDLPQRPKTRHYSPTGC